MLSQKLIDAINAQVNREFYSEYLYLGMAIWFEEQNLDGFANFFRIQMQEERFHLDKFITYLLDCGAPVKLDTIEKPVATWENPLQIFEYSLKHEGSVTAHINNLMKIAKDDNDFASQSFLNWFIDEQVEEEATFTKTVAKLKLIKNDTSGLFMLDNELKTRVFTPPTQA